MHDGAIYIDDSEAWLWVIGIYQSKEHVQFIRVQNRTQETLKLVLNKYVQIGSYIWTDSFKSYNDYSIAGYVHQSVNHSENFLDPDTGAHTQGIEHSWLGAEVWYKRSRGNRVYLQSHLDEAAYNVLRPPETRSGTLFGAFLNDMGQ